MNPIIGRSTGISGLRLRLLLRTWGLLGLPCLGFRVVVDEAEDVRHEMRFAMNASLRL